jgi:hypothetical protein
MYLYPPEAGWLLILVASYDTHGLFTNTLSSCSSLKVTDQVQRPYKTCKIVVFGQIKQ